MAKKQHLVIHHTVTDASLATIERLKTERAYHALILPDGSWHKLRNWTEVGAATAGTNSRTINVALVGRFDPPNKRPGNHQLATLVSVCRRILVDMRLPSSAIVSHQWVGKNLPPYYGTACCGDLGLPDYVRARV